MLFTVACQENDKPPKQQSPVTTQDAPLTLEGYGTEKNEKPARPQPPAPKGGLNFQYNKTLSPQEAQYVGTWVAKVSDLSVQSGGVYFDIPKESKQKNVIQAAVDAFEAGKVEKKRCTWLELYDDHTGFWASCMIHQGEPSIYDKVDPFSGEHTPMGVKFKWYATQDRIRIKFNNALRIPYAKDSVLQRLEVLHWDLMILKKKTKQDGIYYTARDSFPEYDHGFPITNEYEYFDGYLDGKITDYALPIIE